MFAIKIKTFVITIGHDIDNITPYTINRIAPTEFISLKVVKFFIIKEMISTNDAA